MIPKGYADPTAGKAISNVMREERRRREEGNHEPCTEKDSKKIRDGKIRHFPESPPDDNGVSENPDFSAVPVATICQSIQLLINELRSRGMQVYDFDNKEKSVQQVQIIRGKVFFLAAKEGKDEEI